MHDPQVVPVVTVVFLRRDDVAGPAGLLVGSEVQAVAELASKIK